jgi:hypothetical protein
MTRGIRQLVIGAVCASFFVLAGPDTKDAEARHRRRGCCWGGGHGAYYGGGYGYGGACCNTGYGAHYGGYAGYGGGYGCCAPSVTVGVGVGGYGGGCACGY